jgi:hypothetical protein
MRTAIGILVVVLVVGLAALAVVHNYFSAKATGSATPVTVPQAARAPGAAALASPAGTVSNDVVPVQLRSPDSVAAEKRREIRGMYEAAGKISSAVERDKEYATLVGYAMGASDFELAIDIADSMSAVGERDNNYARIVHQAMTVGEIGAADKAAEKISSVILRDEQFKKIAESCPANTTTEGAASVLGLESGTRAGPM